MITAEAAERQRRPRRRPRRPTTHDHAGRVSGHARRRGRARPGRRRPVAARPRAPRSSAMPVRFVRTARHPGGRRSRRARASRSQPLDLLYDRGDDLDTVYGAIASYVVDAAHEHGEVVVRRARQPERRRDARCCCCAPRASRSRSCPACRSPISRGRGSASTRWRGARVVDARAFAIDAAGFAGPMLHRAVRHARSCSPT